MSTKHGRTGHSDRTRNFSGYRLIITMPGHAPENVVCATKRVLRSETAKATDAGAARIEVQTHVGFGRYETTRVIEAAARGVSR